MTTATDDRAAMRAALRANPMDWETRLVYADALEEAGLEGDAARERRVAGRLRAMTVPDGSALRKLIRGIKAEVGYRGRKVKVIVAAHVVPHDVAWGGGSRNQYTLHSPVSGAWRGNAGVFEGLAFPLDALSVLVEDSVFCGKRVGLRIYVHPDCSVAWQE
jgi:uncharacterized protein (TIGR02996 family)